MLLMGGKAGSNVTKWSFTKIFSNWLGFGVLYSFQSIIQNDTEVCGSSKVFSWNNCSATKYPNCQCSIDWNNDK